MHPNKPLLTKSWYWGGVTLSVLLASWLKVTFGLVLLVSQSLPFTSWHKNTPKRAHFSYLAPPLLPTWPSPPLEHIGCNFHAQHILGPTQPPTRKARPWVVLFVFGAFLDPHPPFKHIVGPLHSTTIHNHNDSCMPAIKTTTKEGEGGCTRYICKISYWKKYTNPNPHLSMSYRCGPSPSIAFHFFSITFAFYFHSFFSQYVQEYLYIINN